MKKGNPKELAESLSQRSICSVQVGSALSDHYGVFAWGWNSTGLDHYGLHAEEHSILRANKSRLRGATIYVAAQRRRNQKVVSAKPCLDCQALIDNWEISKVWYRDKDGLWKVSQ